MRVSVLPGDRGFTRKRWQAFVDGAPVEAIVADTDWHFVLVHKHDAGGRIAVSGDGLIVEKRFGTVTLKRLPGRRGGR